jgi:hypothetical protein
MQLLHLFAQGRPVVRHFASSLMVLAWKTISSTYTFGNHAIAHRFCRTAGIPFAENVGEGNE